MPEAATHASPLRIGLLLDSHVQPAWVRAALERVLAGGNGRIVVVALNQQAPRPAGAEPTSSRPATWLRNRSLLLHGVYRRLDRWKFPVRSAASAPTDISDLVADATVVPVTPRQTAFSDYFPDDAVAALRGCDLDVAVRLGFRILRGDALRIARHGVWSYHHGDHETKRGGPPAFWEVMEGEATTGAILQVLGEELDAGRVLMRGWLRTDRFSVARNSAQLYWMAEPFLARAIDLLATEGPEALGLDPCPPPPPVAYAQRLYRVPTGTELARPLARLARRYVAQHAVYLQKTEQWYLAYSRTTRDASRNEQPALAPFRFTSYEPPDGWSWADPFPSRVGGRDFLFFEEFNDRDKKGRIVVTEFGDDGRPGAVVPILDLPYHLAYPFQFSHRGAEYLMPECGTRNAIEVWRARAFPHEWTLEHSMLEGAPWVDATLMPWEGGWVLFAGLDTSSRGNWDELHVFFGETPFGPWRPHRRNPVVVDVRSARPAGRPFMVGGLLLRPAQDGTHSYGYALRLQEIVTLSEREYEERTVTRLVPEWVPGLLGTHTLNHIPGFTVIDARRFVPKSRGTAR